MKLSDFVVREAILVDLQATTKEAAIREIVASLVSAGRLAEADQDGVARAILNREELGSTGIGQGVAVPHTRHPKVDRLVGTVALSSRGVDFPAARFDGDPVDILTSCWSRPRNQPGDHLQALENISRHLKDEHFVSFLRQAKTREAVVDLLNEADQGAHPDPGPGPDRPPRASRSRESTRHAGEAARSDDRPEPLDPGERMGSPSNRRSPNDPTVARREVEILNFLGLHLRPAEKFIGLASSFRADVRVLYQGRECNGKSILDLMTLVALQGSRLELIARGPDAEAVLDALARLVAARFYEDDNGDEIVRQANPPPGG